MVLVHHHIKYKEIHGVDEVILMEKSEHAKLHCRLRKEKKCNIPSEQLHHISSKAFERRRDYSRQLRYYYKNPQTSERKVLMMRIYNNRKVLFAIRPDIVSTAMTPA